MRTRRSSSRYRVLLAALVGACSRTPEAEKAAVPDAKTAEVTSLGASDSGARAQGESSVERAPMRPPTDLNVLLITVDSLRADMPWAGYARPIAPRLTELETHAVSYTRAYSLSSYTSMSLGGMLGGRYPGEMKRDGNFFGKYRDNVMFPELLKAAGIRTLSAHAHLYFIKAAAGFDRGFDVYDMVPGLTWNSSTDENITSPRSESTAERILRNSANTSGRFFAWFHFLDPHDQYQRHPGGVNYGHRARDLYDGEVAFTDRYIGKLLDFVAAQPWGARTAIIFSADHGEAFGEHNFWRHAFELWQPLIRVPWMFVVPGLSPRHIDQNRSHIDMAPTILDLMGVGHEGMEGKSLVPELYGQTEPEARDILVDLPRTSDSDRRRAIIHGNYKLIAYGDDTRYEVYNLALDPDETRSIEQTEQEKFDEMVALYKSKQRELSDIGPYACRKLKGAPVGRAY